MLMLMLQLQHILVAVEPVHGVDEDVFCCSWLLAAGQERRATAAAQQQGAAAVTVARTRLQGCSCPTHQSTSTARCMAGMQLSGSNSLIIAAAAAVCPALGFQCCPVFVCQGNVCQGTVCQGTDGRIACQLLAVNMLHAHLAGCRAGRCLQAVTFQAGAVPTITQGWQQQWRKRISLHSPSAHGLRCFSLPSSAHVCSCTACCRPLLRRCLWLS
jgi:hypothetical protein